MASTLYSRNGFPTEISLIAFRLFLLWSSFGRVWRSEGFEGRIVDESDASFRLHWNHGPFLKWNENEVGKGTEAGEGNDDSTDWIRVFTDDKEPFECSIPKIRSSPKERSRVYEGPSPLTILEDQLFAKRSCSYRIETYWTYEVCHGKFVRQFHESKDTGKRTNLQEYYLGKYERRNQKDVVRSAGGDIPKIPVKKVEDEILPYFEIVMSDGTPCDLDEGRPRRASVLYVCTEGGRNEIAHLEETATCDYTIIILSPALCRHPYYQREEPSVQDIKCYGRDGAKPRRLRAAEDALRNAWTPDEAEVVQSEDATLQPEPSPVEETPATGSTESSSMKSRSNIGEITDRQWIEGFFAGDNCVVGGTGYWQHELCYHKFARQFHRERDGSRLVITLGIWDESEHRKWADRNSKKVKRALTLSNFYSKGDYCDTISRPRGVEVKLKCKSDGDPHSVSIYLLEPETCEYIMGVESPLFCGVIEKAGPDGLFPPEFLGT